MAGSIVFCLAIGYFLDKWLGIRGLFSIIFIFLGIAGGGYTAYRQIEKVVDVKAKKPPHNDKDGRS
ncbi:MAG: AtpZ/AtpI family protein [Deltaproteobacteria bacterium]|nr:AtpZ/AtpI family protein [Deltaproteobacteria bacterium]